MRPASNVFWMLAVGLLLVASVLESDAANNPRGGLQKPAAVANQQTNRLHAPTANTKLVSESVTNLAAKIANALSNSKSKTEIFSPVSIAGALSLLLLGSGGRTQEELLAVMGLNKGQLSFQEIHISFGRLFQDLVSNDPSLEPLVTWRLNDKCNRYDEEDDEEDFPLAPASTNPGEYPSHQISIANGVFLQKDLQPGDRYLQLTQRVYKGTVKNLDFERDSSGAAAFINDWCSVATKGKIKEIVTEDLLRNTRMIVANALYFKAQWETTFSPLGTRQRLFYPNGRLEPAISVESMATSGCFPYYNATAEFDVQIIGLPYEMGKSTMYIILPNGSTRQKMQDKLAAFDASHLNWLIDRMVVKKGMVVLPKLNISNRIRMGTILQRLGIRELFDPTQSNLTEIFNDKPAGLSIDTGFQSEPNNPLNTQSRLDVTETPKVQITTQKPTALPPTRQDTGQPPQTSQQALPLPGSSQPSNVQQTVSFDTTAHDCRLIENCQYTPSSNKCTCNRIPTIDDHNQGCGAHLAKHYYDDTNKHCQFGFTSSSLSTHICVKPSYRLSPDLKSPEACEQRYECKMFRNFCYCCNSNVPLQQPLTQRPTVTNNQPMIENRFGGNEAAYNTLPYPNQPAYSSDLSRVTCYGIPELSNSYICRLYGYHWEVLQNVCIDITTCTSSPRIKKRQAPFPPSYRQQVQATSQPQVPHQQLLAQPELQQLSIQQRQQQDQQFQSNQQPPLQSRLSTQQTGFSQQVQQQQQVRPLPQQQQTRFQQQPPVQQQQTRFQQQPPVQQQQQGSFQPQTIQRQTQQQQQNQVQQQRPVQQQQRPVQQQQQRPPQRHYESVHVNEIITQVTLDVNEQGTEGGAVTVALIDRIGPGYSFVVDSPFLIFIRNDKTQLPLFYGAVYDPRP
uniref:Serpin domain-containing protein n=1 Tax=Anopheles minimus TaxID=112268 RepID=A0A2C9H5Z2_9DIPT